MLIVAMGLPGTPVMVCAMDETAVNANTTPHQSVVVTRFAFISFSLSVCYYLEGEFTGRLKNTQPTRFTTDSVDLHNAGRFPRALAHR